MVYITWEPLSLTFFKINFDSSMTNSSGGTKFVIKGTDSMFIVAGEVCLFGTTILRAELWAISNGISFRRLVLGADWLVVEGDSMMVVGWI